MAERIGFTPVYLDDAIGQMIADLIAAPSHTWVIVAGDEPAANIRGALGAVFGMVADRRRPMEFAPRGGGGRALLVRTGGFQEVLGLHSLHGAILVQRMEAAHFWSVRRELLYRLHRYGGPLLISEVGSDGQARLRGLYEAERKLRAESGVAFGAAVGRAQVAERVMLRRELDRLEGTAPCRAGTAEDGYRQAIAEMRSVLSAADAAAGVGRG